MNKLIEKLQKRLMPLANKISQVMFLSALGATFQILLPVIMIGSFACLGAFLDIPAWQNFVGSTGLGAVFMTLQSLTLSIITLYIAFVLPYQYASKLGMTPLPSAITTLMTFLILTPTELYTNIPEQWLGFPGLFTCMIVTVLVVRMNKLMEDKGIYIHMPDGVPPMVEASFKALLPTVICAVVGVTVSTLMAKTSFGCIHQVIYSFIQTPLQSFGLSFPSYLVMQLMTTLFMFCGIHGDAIRGIFTPLTMAASEQNLAALAAGNSLPNIIIDSFSVLCQPGGIGCTFGLAFLMAFLAKSKRMKTLGKMSIIPAIFGINEPILFGIPIMLNPLLFIPYVLSPIVCISLSYCSIALGITPRLNGTMVNWTMPQIVSGFLAQGVPTAILQVVLILITTAIWFPFFKMVDRQICEEEKGV